MRKILAAAALAALLAAAPAQATNGMRMIGFGPVQSSMGGVGVGATLDSCSMLSNPAGISDMAMRLDVGASWFKPTVEYKAVESPQLPPGVPAGAFVNRSGTTFDSNRGGSPIPALGFVLPLGAGFTGGLGLFAVAGMGVDYDQNLYSGKTYTSYLQARVTPAVAYRFNEMFSAGLTLNAMVAQMKWDVASGVGQVPHDTASAFGIGATIGLQFKPIKGMALGVAYETKSFFGDFSFDVPPHQVPNPNPPPPAVTLSGKDKLDFDQPSSLTFGASAQAAEWVLLAVDLQWIRWSETNGKDQPKFTNDTRQTGTLPWNLSWKDQWVVKLGAQIDASQALKLRVGWNYGKAPLDDTRAFENIAFPAIAEHHITAGAGYAVNQNLTVNAGGMYAPQVTLTGVNFNQGLASYETKMSQWQADLGVSYRF